METVDKCVGINFVQRINSIHRGWVATRLERLHVCVPVFGRIRSILDFVQPSVPHRQDHSIAHQSRIDCYGLQKSKMLLIFVITIHQWHAGLRNIQSKIQWYTYWHCCEKYIHSTEQS